MAIVLYDTFDEASTTDIASHTPNTGSGSWSPSSTFQIIGGSGRVTQNSTAANQNIIFSGASSTADYTIELECSDYGSSNRVVFVFLNDDYYRVGFNFVLNEVDVRETSGYTQLAQASVTYSTGRALKVQRTATQIIITVNGSVVLTYNTSSHFTVPTYTLVQLREMGINTITVTDTASAAPTINTQPTAQTANEPATAGFTVAATTSGGSLTYQWKRAEPGSGTYSNVSTGTGGTTASYTTAATSAASDHSATYKCTVTDDNGSTDTDAVTLTVRSTTTTARPSADVTTSGWTASTGSDFFALLDEVTYDDADYVTSPTLSGSTAPLVVQLKYPINTATWTVGCRASTSSGTATLTAYLLNDSDTVVGTSSGQTITATPTSYSLPITLSGPATRLKIAIVV